MLINNLNSNNGVNKKEIKEIFEKVSISSKNVKTTYKMGNTINAEVEGKKIKAEIAPNTLVVDVGSLDLSSHIKELSKIGYKKEDIESWVHKLYRKSINSGNIDHHYIDRILKENKIKGKEMCATKMVNDFSENVKFVIKTKDIKYTDTHQNPDLDAIGSSYLTQYLIQKGDLPKMSEDFSTLENDYDYKKFDLPIEQFVKSLPGYFEALKKQAKIAGLNQEQEYASYFELLNAVETIYNIKELKENGFDIRKNMSSIKDVLSKETYELIQNGIKNMLEEDKQIESDLEKALDTKSTIFVNGKEYPLIIARTNNRNSLSKKAYKKIPADTIVATFSENNIPGYNYNIFVGPGKNTEIDMSEICIELNKKELEKRESIKDTTDENLKKILKEINESNPRLGMSGQVPPTELNDDEKKAWLVENQIITKSPTVIVMQGAVLASTQDSLITFEEFEEILKDLAIPTRVPSIIKHIKETRKKVDDILKL